MRHRMKGRKLGRNPSHRRAMLKNLASSLFLSERSEDVDEKGAPYDESARPGNGRNEPKVKGRVITTLQKAKQVRPLVEKCITIARHALKSQQQAEAFGTTARRRTEEYRAWRTSEEWQKWNQAIAPALTARRRAIKLLGNKRAVSILFDEVAPRFADRNGGYTRIMRLASPRLGDAGTRAILEFVGQHDRVQQKSEKPAFADEPLDEPPAEEEAAAAETEQAPVEGAPVEDAPVEDAPVDGAAAEESAAQSSDTTEEEPEDKKS